jgi:hypothetical protein
MTTAAATDTSWAGAVRMPRLMISVVAPAGGCGMPINVSTSVVSATDRAPLMTCSGVSPPTGAEGSSCNPKA